MKSALLRRPMSCARLVRGLPAWRHHPHLDARRPGLTLVELLVAVAVMSAIFALVLSAVQAARQTARRARCMSNLRQVGLALHAYHAAAGSLPPGRAKMYDPRYSGTAPPCTASSVDKSFLIHILPYIENEALFNAVNQQLSILGAENTTVWGASVAAYVCPADTASAFLHAVDPGLLPRRGGIPATVAGPCFMSLTSYSGCYGSLNTRALPSPRHDCRVAPEAVAQNNGCFNDVSPIRLESITDGLSQTVLCGERANPSSGPDVHGWYVTGNLGDTLFTSMFPPNSTQPGTSVLIPASASSFHPGGLNVLMADGSVRFIMNSIQSWELDTHRPLPAGAERNREGWLQNLPNPGV